MLIFYSKLKTMKKTKQNPLVNKLQSILFKTTTILSRWRETHLKEIPS